jgi:hypothetical protein
LVGDSDGRELRGRDASLLHCHLDDLRCSLGDFQRVMLDPARAGENLLVLQLMSGHFLPLTVKDHKTGAGCPLIYRADVLTHRESLPFRNQKPTIEFSNGPKRITCQVTALLVAWFNC